MPAKNVNRRLDDLRRRAEKRLGQQNHPEYLSEALEIAQELRVHQVELELQNEELQSTQAALSQANEAGPPSLRPRQSGCKKPTLR
jgi:hypothetical protein